MRGPRWGAVRRARSAGERAGSVTTVLLLAAGCASVPRPPRVVYYLDHGWFDREYRAWSNSELQNFRRETGIQVQILPSPEANVDHLSLSLRLLSSRSATPDVYAVDCIWPGILGDHLIDLRPYLEGDLSGHFPEALAMNAVNGRLVAAPCRANFGLLYYRTDLLRKYGYRGPPETWEALERMAARIQAGERVAGRKDFWGFVWQGAPSEALTCNALEWQASEGGGRIIEPDGRISVNNAATVKAWQMAARWVGKISPPGVVAYLEWDAANIWTSGDAAFMRAWASAYAVSRRAAPVGGRFAVTVLPRGQAGHVSTLGMTSYGVSRYSRRPADAVALVRHLIRRDVQLRRSRASAGPPTAPDLYDDSESLAVNPYYRRLKQVWREELLVRPAAVTGKKYPEVSRAYFRAVHSVLTGKAQARAAAEALETRLVQILRE